MRKFCGLAYHLLLSSLFWDDVSAFAGGFGGSKSSGSRATKKKRKVKKGLNELKPSTVVEKSSAKVLDKWGLPPPTVEDIFPRMGPDTELIPVEPGKKYSLDEIKVALRQQIPLDLTSFEVDPASVTLHHISPPVLTIENFFSASECRDNKKIASTSDNGNGDVVQVDSATFSKFAQSVRTSTSWFCRYKAIPTLLAKAHMLNIDLEQMEEPQIVRYQSGQEFSWHYDEVPPPQLSNGGQRLLTLLVYLNNVENGGGTVFRDLKDGNGDMLSVQPRQGTALLFFPGFGDGRPDDRTLHKGQVVKGDDEKWIVQMWVHERAYRAALPPHNVQEEATGAVTELLTRWGQDIS